MPAPLNLIATEGEIPKTADAVVIGAGIVGAFAAFYLAKRGMRVALVEKGRVGAEQSSRNWGWCRQQNRDARELPMATRSLDLWDQFSIETGQNTGFRRCGLLYLSDDEEQLARWTKWRNFARSFGVVTNVLDSAGASELGKHTLRRWKGGVFSPTDGIADPAAAAPAVARALLSTNGSVHQNCAARGIETENGRLSAVVTEHGVIRTKLAVLAGGAWASSFCRQLGVRFPQASVRSSILSVSACADSIPDALHTDSVSLTRRGDGGHALAISGRGRVDPTAQNVRYAAQFLPMFLRRRRSLSPGGLEGVRSGHESLARWRLDRPTPMERTRILDPTVDKATIRLTLERARQLIPALRASNVTAAWAGYIDSTPDGVPAIGELAAVPGLILAAGFSGHGFGIGPGAGHLIADIATGADPIVDPVPFHPDRFTQSSWGRVAEF